MTWKEFCDSQHNVDSRFSYLSIETFPILYNDGSNTLGVYQDNDENQIFGTSTIIDSGVYDAHVFSGGSND